MSSRLLAALICKARGHDDRNLTPGVKRGAPMVECRRCKRTGWLLVSAKP